MGCELLSRTGAFLDRELPPPDREAYEAHLATCAECSRELARLERLSRFLSAAGMPDISRQRLLWKAQVSRQRLVRFAEMLMAAAVLVMALCGLWLFRMSARSEATAVSGWEQAALSQQAEPPPGPEADDPLVQVLLRGQP